MRFLMKIMLALSLFALPASAQQYMKALPLWTSPDNFTPNFPRNAGLTFYTDDRFAGIPGWAPPDYYQQVMYGFFQPGGLVNVEQGTYARTGVITPYGTTALDMAYPGNDAGNGVGPAGFISAYHPMTEFYFATSMYVPPNYVMHSNNGSEKFWYPIIDVGKYVPDPPGNTSSPLQFSYLNGSPTGPTFGFLLGLQKTVNGEWYYQDPTTELARKGEWTLIEVHGKMNTPGQRNGFMHTWINGKKALFVDSLDFVDNIKDPRGLTVQAAW